MNYIDIINHFWADAPYRSGYKSDYGILYFAILDSINKNKWNEVDVEYELIISKTKLGKRMYLSGRSWLCENGYITLTKGLNDYARAKFFLGENVLIAVQKCTTTVPTTVPTTSTATVPTSVPTTVPYYNKTIDSKNIDNNTGDKPPQSKPKPNGFSKPNESDVAAYLTEKTGVRGQVVQDFAGRFIDYYSSNGWRVGKNQMKDWQAAVRSWISKEPEKWIVSSSQVRKPPKVVV